MVAGGGLCPLPSSKASVQGGLWGVCCLLPAMFAHLSGRIRPKVSRCGLQRQLKNSCGGWGGRREQSPQQEGWDWWPGTLRPGHVRGQAASLGLQVSSARPQSLSSPLGPRVLAPVRTPPSPQNPCTPPGLSPGTSKHLPPAELWEGTWGGGEAAESALSPLSGKSPFTPSFWKTEISFAFHEIHPSGQHSGPPQPQNLVGRLSRKMARWRPPG